MEDEYLQVVTATDSRGEADRIAQAVVEARLAACAQVSGTIASTYWWRGAVETAEEWVVVMKTTSGRLDDLMDRVRAEHSYEVPEITATAIVEGNPAYLSWIDEETRPRG